MRAFGKAYPARVVEGENIPALSARKCINKSGEAGFFHLGPERKSVAIIEHFGLVTERGGYH
jgi:hypothetical protein